MSAWIKIGAKRLQGDHRMAIPLADLATQTRNQLARSWVELGVRGDPPHFKQALVRGISWHLQTRSQGAIDAETRRLLKAAIRRAPSPDGTRATRRTTRRPTHRTTHRTARDKVTLDTGTVLVRRWRGREHEVTVLDGGRAYRYRETEYASLSEIAREITGARWSGPRFFGLTALKRTP